MEQPGLVAHPQLQKRSKSAVGDLVRESGAAGDSNESTIANTKKSAVGELLRESGAAGASNASTI